jgi:hypothetical protein
MRQRVQLLKSADQPWITLLQSSSTTDKTRLSEIARSSNLEPHPVSGEIEVDWDHDVQVRFRRFDPERLEGLVVVKELNLFFRLVYCTGAEDAQGWKIGEVGVAKKLDGSLCELDVFCGYQTISIAEEEHSNEGRRVSRSSSRDESVNLPEFSNLPASQEADDGEDDDDDGYWDRYDATPARTPANKRSPAPQSLQQRPAPSGLSMASAADAEDAYFSQYDSVQPAMDNHDPDEEVDDTQAAARPLGFHSLVQSKPPVPPLGLSGDSAAGDSSGSSAGTNHGSPEVTNDRKLSMSTHSSPPSYNQAEAEDAAKHHADLLHPRPASPASSKGSESVARLEEAAENYGVQRHISRSVKNLFLLARSSGVDREDFEELVKRELDALAMVPDDEY